MMLKHDVHFRLIGDPSRLPDFVQTPLNKALAATQENRGMRLHLAVNYGGRAELVRAVRLIAEAVQRGELQPEDIDEAVISQHTYTPDTPDPDLIIRTSGEQRISNFLTWQGCMRNYTSPPSSGRISTKPISIAPCWISRTASAGWEEQHPPAL